MVTVNLGFAHYWLDHVYGALMHRLRLAPPFFSKGWGGPQLELLEQLIRQNISQGLVQVSSQHWPPPSIRPAWKTLWESRNACLQEGTFLTPCDAMLREVLPCESHIARVRMLSPRHTPAHQTACVVHLAGTGDHGFERRLRLGAPLLKQNIATMVLERHMDLTLWDEGLVLLTVFFFCFGCSPFYGGVHAAMVGSLHPTPVAILPFLTPHSAAVAFCEGILQHGTAWEVLMRDKLLSGSMTREQVVERMRTVLALTDVTCFPLPKNPSAVIFVAATVSLLSFVHDYMLLFVII
jgi:hypothetical protein